MEALDTIFGGFAISALRSATPLLLVMLGECLTQRTGVINLGVEGQMLVGAMVAYGTTAASGSPWLGLAAGCAAGSALAAIHALLVVGARANQFGSGLSVWMLGFGLSAFFGSALVGLKIEPLPDIGIKALGATPVIGSLATGMTPTVLIALALVPLTSWWLFGTRTGLHWRAVGESPDAARSAGLSPSRIRVAAVLVGGAFSGLGGAALSVDYTRTWAEGMTAGRGLVAVGLVIVARWRPWLTLPAALLFGGAEALSLRLQAAGVTVSAQLLHTLPYLASIAVLAFTYRGSRDAGTPAGLKAVMDR